MAAPPNATPLTTQQLDPADILDFQITLTQGALTDLPPPMLLTGEQVASFTLNLAADAVAAGLQIKSDGTYPAPTLSGNLITFWLGVAAASQGNASFAGSGLTLSMELTITTTSSPPRVKQRTVTVQVANQ